MTTHVNKARFAPDDAVAFVDHVDAMRRSRHWRGGLLSLLGGAALIAVGVGITAFTYVNAEPGGAYWVTWGVVWGVVRVGFGVNRMAKKFSSLSTNAPTYALSAAFSRVSTHSKSSPSTAESLSRVSSRMRM